MFVSRKLLKHSLFWLPAGGFLYSLHSNNYDLGSVGAIRFGRAAVTVFDIGLCYKKQGYAKKLDPESDEYRQIRSKTHYQGAEKLLELCRANKGVYIKVGQHIGALEYLLPKEYVNTLKVLHSHAPSSSLEEISAVLKEDLKRDPAEIFDSMEDEPLGAASLAQVHKAVLKNGETVAVKIQHPYVRSHSVVDMKTMEVLVYIVSWVFPEFKFRWLVDEMKRNIPQELDFSHEAKNTEHARRIFKHFPWLKIPTIYSDLSTSRVLTMEFVEGGQVNDLDYIRNNKINPFDVSDKLGRVYSEMIFNSGFIHSDPHPGNILVRKVKSGTQLILLDHGLYATLSPDFRYNYSKLWMSILNKDKDGMRKYCDYLGVGDAYALLACMVSGRTWDAIESGINKVEYTTNERDLFQKEIPGLLPKLTEILQTVNREMLLVLKTNDLLRGIEFTLQTHSRKASFLVMSQCCVKSIYEDKLREVNDRWARLRILIAERWALFTLSVYYTYLSLKTFSFSDTFRILF
ncbi:unnamed protein product [Bemisia tabaci]|uniref:Protein kinase domain-containing protein n=1 Tax=Bemisia tabaci TaxID=7038 RepID=A0A9P0F0E7_BEMTA|nr:unnamed protein product [Bemisia tabaci]